MKIWDRPTYAPSVAGKLLGLETDRVRRWLRGYLYAYTSVRDGRRRKVHQAPVIDRPASARSSFASFLELVDLLFVKKFLEHGVSLQKMRKALAEARELIGEQHFAQRDFFTDGHNIYLQIVEEKPDSLLQLLTGGQWVISEVIRQTAYQVEFDGLTGLARRWYPLGTEGRVVLDPDVSFGTPIVRDRGVSTANVYDFYKAEGGDVEKVCDWMGLERTEVESAIEFEERLLAA